MYQLLEFLFTNYYSVMYVSVFLFSTKSPKPANQNKPTKQARQWAGEGSVKEATQLNYSVTDGNEESLVVSGHVCPDDIIM